MNIECEHLSNVQDSNGIHDYVVIHKVSLDSVADIRDWNNKKTWRSITVYDDSGRHKSNVRYRCLQITYEYGHMILKLEKKQ